MQASRYLVFRVNFVKKANHVISYLVLSDFLNVSRMDNLRQKLENQGLRDVGYMVINHQGAQAQSLHTMLVERLSEHISLYKQDEALPDVWQTLGGSKDDFLIYDRCDTHKGARRFYF